MKPIIPYCLTAGCFWIAIFCGATTHMSARSVHRPHKWDKFYFVHHWPVTVCKAFLPCIILGTTPILHESLDIFTEQVWHHIQDSWMNSNDCKDPLMYWTIHGLWPDKEEECNRTWHFNISELKDLMGDMEQYWPDVLHPNQTHFWKHEWDKHGTCAAELESLNSEKKYFSKALELYKELNLNSYLLKLGIKPGSTYYQMAAIREALTSVYNVTPKIQCLPPEEGQLQIIGQIKFCLTKEFALRNCTELESVSFSAHEKKFFNTEDLSSCNDTLTYYPSDVHTSKYFVAKIVKL